VIGAKVVNDPITKTSKGFGFVKFSNQEESQRSIREMQGSILRGRAIKTSQAYMKNSSNDSTLANLQNMFLNPLLSMSTPTLSTNTTYSSGYGTPTGTTTPYQQPFSTGLYPTMGMGMGMGMMPTMPMMTPFQMMPAFGYAYPTTMQTQGYANVQPTMTTQTTGQMGNYYDPNAMAQATMTQQGYAYPQQAYAYGYPAQFPVQQTMQQTANPLMVQNTTSPRVNQQTPNQQMVQGQSPQTTAGTKPKETPQKKSSEQMSVESKGGQKMAEEKHLEPIMEFNTNFIETNFRVDFLNTDKFRYL